MMAYINPYIKPFIIPIRELAKKNNIDKLILFGSSITPYFQFFQSDIDIYIVSGLEEQINFERDFYNLIEHKYPVDVFEERTIDKDSEFYQEIMKGVAVYEKEIIT